MIRHYFTQACHNLVEYPRILQNPGQLRNMGDERGPFDIVVLNYMDRFHRPGDVIDRLPEPGAQAAHAKQSFRKKLLENKPCVATHGEDMSEIRNRKWTQSATRK